jgi:hypothetical protein
MKRTKRRILSLILCLLLCIAMQPIPAFGATITDTPVLSVVYAEGAPGEDISVDIDISSNPGIMGLKFTVDYDDSYMTLTGFTDGEFTGWQRNGNSFIWVGGADSDVEGTIISLIFTADTAAVSGDYNVTLSCGTEDVGNHAEDLFIPQFLGGVVHIHNWSQVTYTWAADNSTASAFRSCDAPNACVEEETVDVVATITTPEACESTGWTTYVATFSNAAFEEQTKVLNDRPALGHDWSEVSYTWADDHSTLTASRSCGNDAAHDEEETVSVTAAVTTPAACESKGWHTYSSAAFTNTAFTAQVLALEDIDALGHAWSEVTYTWAADHSTASAIRTCQNDGTHVESETVNVVTDTIQEPTCTEPGTHGYVANFTNPAFEQQSITLGDIPAKGHDYGDPVYTWAADYSTASAVKTCKHDASHVISETVNSTSVVATPAACEAKGWTTYTAAFTNADFVQQTQTVEDIDALGHDWDTPTYTWAADNSTVSAIAVCKNDPSHVQTETVNTVISIIKEATCEEDGKEGFVATFTKEPFETQSKELNSIPAIGHAWGTPTYTWAEDNSTVTAIRICGNDASHVQSETVNTVGVATTPAACEAKGWTTYTASFTNTAFAEQTRTAEDIEALGHDWGTPSYEWSEDNSTVTASAICTRDASHVLTETVNTTSQVSKQPTTEEKGETTWTAEFTNDVFKAAPPEPKTEENIPVRVQTATMPAGGGFTGSKEIALETDVTGAAIYYTTDGSDPDENSTLYTEPFTITSTTTVKAVVVLDGYSNSEITTAVYTVYSYSDDDDEPAPQPEPAIEVPDYVDVPEGSYYEDAVDWVVGNGIMEDSDEEHFKPENPGTRAQLVYYIWVAAGSPEPTSSTNPFEDVHESDDYYTAVLWAVENNIAQGTSATTFRPDKSVTRAQTITFIYRAMGYFVDAVSPFEDVPEESYYFDAVNWAYAAGVTEGTSTNKFSPEEYCIRAQIATFLYRTYSEK